MKPRKLNHEKKEGTALRMAAVILVAGFICFGMTGSSHAGNRPFVNVRVADVQVSQVDGASGKLTQVSVTITDLYENPIAGATVCGEFSGRIKSVVYGVTDKDGKIRFQTNQKGSYTFTVNDVSCARFRYELFQGKVARINTMETAAINPEVIMIGR